MKRCILRPGCDHCTSRAATAPRGNRLQFVSQIPEPYAGMSREIANCRPLDAGVLDFRPAPSEPDEPQSLEVGGHSYIAERLLRQEKTLDLEDSNGEKRAARPGRLLCFVGVRSLSKERSAPLILTFGDNNIAIYRKFRKSLSGAARQWPFHFEPIHLAARPEPQHHARIV